MSLHPQAAAFLARQRRDGIRPDHELTIAQLRARADVAPQDTETVRSVRRTAVPSPAGPVPVQVYTPTESPQGVVVYLHGGRHVTGTIARYDALTRRLANRVPATVVSVGYQRAPEHRCPAVEDAYAVFLWSVEHALDLAPRSDGRVALAGRPPAYVLTVQYDVLRDEGEAYATALHDAGVQVNHRRWDGHLHGFLGDPASFSDAEPALVEIARALSTALRAS